MTRTHVSLFAGIGAMDIAAEHCGYETTHCVEIDPFCRGILAKRFPGATLHDDVCAVGAAELGVGMDLLSGGFPCQDLSSAGNGAGLEGARSGLWFEFLRIIRECRPKAVLIENVAVLKSRGLDVVVRGLADAGYGCWWDCVPALAVGAPHLRDRIWITAVPFDRMPPLSAFGASKAPAKMPRAGYASGSPTMPWLTEVAPHATIRMCKEAMGAVKGANGVTWLTKLDCPLFTTPSASSYGSNRGGAAGRVGPVRHSLPSMARNGSWPRLWPTPHGMRHPDAPRAAGPSGNEPGPLNPDWVEGLMLLPIGWTDPDCANPVQRDFQWVDARIPRTAASVPHRKQRLMACGNALVWQVAATRLQQLDRLMA